MTQLAVAADWLSSWLWIVFVIALAYILLLFPDGNLSSRRWRWVGRSIAATGALLLLVPVATWQARSPAMRLMDFWPDEGPTPDALVWSLNALVGLLLALVVVAAVSLLVRFRGSAGVERQQLRWIAAAGAAFVGFLALGAAGDRVDAVPLQFLFEVGGGLAIARLPVAIGVAVLRYRLFDLDALAHEFRDLVAVTFRPEAVSVWLRDASVTTSAAGGVQGVVHPHAADVGV